MPGSKPTYLPGEFVGWFGANSAGVIGFYEDAGYPSLALQHEPTFPRPYVVGVVPWSGFGSSVPNILTGSYTDGPRVDTIATNLASQLLRTDTGARLWGATWLEYAAAMRAIDPEYYSELGYGAYEHLGFVPSSVGSPGSYIDEPVYEMPARSYLSGMETEGLGFSLWPTPSDDVDVLRQDTVMSDALALWDFGISTPIFDTRFDLPLVAVGGSYIWSYGEYWRDPAYFFLSDLWSGGGYGSTVELWSTSHRPYPSVGNGSHYSDIAYDKGNGMLTCAFLPPLSGVYRYTDGTIYFDRVRLNDEMAFEYQSTLVPVDTGYRGRYIAVADVLHVPGYVYVLLGFPKPPFLYKGYGYLSEVLVLDSTSYEIVDRFGGSGPDGTLPPILSNATDLSVDGQGFIYVADYGNARVAVFKGYAGTESTSQTSRFILWNRQRMV